MLDKVKNEQKRKVLVVDDEMINRMMLGNIVEKNYDVLYAENGQEALEIIRQNGKRLSAEGRGSAEGNAGHRANFRSHSRSPEHPDGRGRFHQEAL